MEARANISFFESLNSCGGSTVYYDQPIENGLLDRVRNWGWVRGLRHKLRDFVVSDSDVNTEMEILASMTKPHISKMQTVLSLIRQELEKAVYSKPDVNEVTFQRLRDATDAVARNYTALVNAIKHYQVYTKVRNGEYTLRAGSR